MIHRMVRVVGETWKVLTRPSAMLTAPDERERASLLAATMLAFLPLMLAATFIFLPVALSGTANSELPNGLLFVLGLGAIIATALAYVLSRTQHYRIGAVVFTGFVAAATYLAAIFSQIDLLGRSLIILWLPLTVLAASAFLSPRATAALSVISVAMVALLPTMTSEFHSDNVAGPLIYTLAFCLLIVITKYYRTRLYAITLRQAQELALLDEVRTTMAREVDLSTLLRTIMTSITETFGYTQISLYRLNGDTLVLQRQAGYDHAIEQIPISQGVAGRVARTGEPILIEDVHSDPEFIGAIKGIVSEVCVPLMHEGKVAGILNVESIHGIKLTEADLHLMVRLGKDIEVAIGRAELYDDIQRQLAERRRAEEALQEARTFLQQVVDTSPSMIFVVDGQGRAIFVNQYAAQYYGSTPEELVSKSTQDVHQPAAEAQEFVSDDQEVIRKRSRIVKEELNTAPNGEQHWFQTVKVPLVRPDGRVDVLGISTDITERKRAEDELKRHKEHLEELVEQRTAELKAANNHLVALGRARDEFVSNVSHELRTPITNIKLYLELLGISPEKHDSYLVTLKRESLRLENLIENLLMLSRMDQHRIVLNLTPVNLNTLAEEYVTDRMALAENKRLKLALQTENALPEVSVDRDLLGAVIGILLTNALNYTPAGGMIDVRTQKQRFDRRMWAGITVTDSGPGIEPEDMERLFTRFFRGKAGIGSGMAGTGLGLAIASEIIGRHHGRIEVANRPKPDRGAIFQIWLPPAKPAGA